MSRISYVLIAVLVLMLASPASAETIKGLWMTGDGSKIIKIDECRDMLCGNVVWLKSTDAKSFARDPLCGRQVFYGFKVNPDNPNKWKDGQIYVESEGMFVDSHVERLNAETIVVKTGKRGAGIFNKLPFVRDTDEWTRVDGADYTYCGSPAAGVY